jgi:hypothetical protein
MNERRFFRNEVVEDGREVRQLEKSSLTIAKGFEKSMEEEFTKKKRKVQRVRITEMLDE